MALTTHLLDASDYAEEDLLPAGTFAGEGLELELCSSHSTLQATTHITHVPWLRPPETGIRAPRVPK